MGDHGCAWSTIYGQSITNFQTSLKVPLLIKYPEQTKNPRIQSVVELIDLFPTLWAK